MTVGLTSARAQVKPSFATRARLLRIEDTRHDEPTFLDSLLSGADPVARAWAAMTAGRLGAHSHAASLRRIAVEPDSGAAGNAFFALGLLRDTASVGIAAAALHDAPPRSVEAARLLGEVGAAGRDAIITGLADTGVSRPARAALLLSAARLRPVPAAAVSPLLADRDSALAWRAAYVLARGRSAAGARALLSASSSPWAAVREQVARGASKAIVGDSLSAPASAALLVLVRDTSARVRANAVRSLASFGPSTRVAVLAALADPDPNVALSAAELLDAVLGDDIADWTRAFDARKIFVVQNAVVVAGARRGKRLDEYGGWAESPDWHRRVATTGHLAQGNPSMVFAEFARKMLDTDGRVRAAATRALVTLVDSAAYRDSTRALLGLRLADRDVQVRTAALSGLAHGATATDLGAALKSFALARRDADGDARLAFWQLVDSALTHQGEGLPDSVDRKLAAIGRPSDPGERAAAARIVRFASWKDTAGTARPLQWYEARAREAMRPAPTLRIQTARGSMELRLFVGDAPLTVYNISSLARRGYFNGQSFHRVVPNFVIQGGDPRGDGTGGPGYAIRDELNRRRYVRGTLGMALSGPNTGGSQFFITHSPQPHLDAGYTVFGELLRGGEVLDRIVQGDRIVRISVH